MTDEITPALSAEEWHNSATEKASAYGDSIGIGEGFDTVSFEGKERHALAALVLYGQPFGFTYEDVEILRGALERIRQDAAVGAFAFYEPRLTSLADRIAALLPPANEAP